MYQRFDVAVVSPVCNFIKNETLTQVFSCEFCELFQPETLLKTRLQHRCFPVSFEKLLSTTLEKRETRVKRFLAKFETFLQPLH